MYPDGGVLAGPYLPPPPPARIKHAVFVLKTSFSVLFGGGGMYRCHVMERESFESKAVARVLNEKFVSIKARAG